MAASGQINLANIQQRPRPILKIMLVIFITLLKTICIEAVVPWSTHDVVSTFTRRLHDVFTCLSEGKKCSFFGKFGVLCLLETPVLRFALLPYYRGFVKSPLLDL